LKERLDKELEIALRENIISLPVNNSQPTYPDFFLEKFEVSKNQTRSGFSCHLIGRHDFCSHHEKSTNFTIFPSHPEIQISCNFNSTNILFRATRNCWKTEELIQNSTKSSIPSPLTYLPNNLTEEQCLFMSKSDIFLSPVNSKNCNLSCLNKTSCLNDEENFEISQNLSKIDTPVNFMPMNSNKSFKKLGDVEVNGSKASFGALIVTLVIFVILFLMGLVSCSGTENAAQFSPRESCSIEEEIVTDDRNQLIGDRQKSEKPVSERPISNSLEGDKRHQSSGYSSMTQTESEKENKKVRKVSGRLVKTQVQVHRTTFQELESMI